MHGVDLSAGALAVARTRVREARLFRADMLALPFASGVFDALVCAGSTIDFVDATRIVINTDKEGFAHSYNITHGTSVCAIGFMVDDAGKTLDRAQRLLDQPFRQAVGPGELEIPAVRGVGGSLLYFIDPKSDLARVWDVEFEPTGEDAKKQGAGLTTVDHISQSMHYEEMLTWLLFYTSLLDLAKLPEQDVADPGGLVKRQVVKSPDGSLRLWLRHDQEGDRV